MANHSDSETKSLLDVGDSRQISRRDFIKLSSASAAFVLGARLLNLPGPFIAEADSSGEIVSEIPIIWIQAGSCSGCSVSFLNTLSPKAQNVLMDQVVPGKHLGVQFHPTVMASSGDLTMKAMEDTARNNKGGYVLVAEGAFSTKDNGVFDYGGD